MHLVCSYCGALAVGASRVDERKALDEYYGALVDADKKRAAKLLRGGFFPTQPDVLVEAGIRLIPMFEYTIWQDPEVAEAATARLKGLVVRLRIHRSEPQVQDALSALEETLARRDKAIDKEQRQGCFNILLGIAIVMAIITWLLKMFGD